MRHSFDFIDLGQILLFFAVFRHPQIGWQEFVKQTCRTQKNSARFVFQEFVFEAKSSVILNVIEDVCYFWVYI